jgi:hypothetical protein
MMRESMDKIHHVLPLRILRLVKHVLSLESMDIQKGGKTQCDKQERKSQMETIVRIIVGSAAAWAADQVAKTIIRALKKK